MNQTTLSYIIQISEALSSLRLHPWGFQLVLLQGVCESIANGQAFQRDLLPLTCLQGLQNIAGEWFMF